MKYEICSKLTVVFLLISSICVGAYFFDFEYPQVLNQPSFDFDYEFDSPKLSEFVYFADESESQNDQNLSEQSSSLNSESVLSAESERAVALEIESPEVPIVEPLEVDDSEVVTSIHRIEDEYYINESYEFKESNEDRSVSQLSAYSAPSNTNLNKLVMGFAPYWDLSAGNYVNYQYDKLSVISYFALTCSDYGDWVVDNGYSGWNSAQMDDLITRAHARGTKVVLVVKNFHNRSIQDIVANKNGARDKLIDNIITELARKNADGVNIDFEFVADSSYPVTNELRANIVTFADLVAERVHAERPGSHVSIDVYGGSGSWYDPYDVAALAQTDIDKIMVMSYDFYTTSAYSGKFGAPTSPTRGSQYWFTLEESMTAMVSKAASNKILMGIPYYGLEFPVQQDSYNSSVRANCSYLGGAYSSNCPGLTASYSSIVSDISYCNASSKRLSSTDNVRWYTYSYGTVNTSSGYTIPSGWWQGYYDDEITLSEKYDIVNEMNLGGVAIWALGYDNGRSELWDLLAVKFAKAKNRELF